MLRTAVEVIGVVALVVVAYLLITTHFELAEVREARDALADTLETRAAHRIELEERIAEDSAVVDSLKREAREARQDAIDAQGDLAQHLAMRGDTTGKELLGRLQARSDDEVRIWVAISETQESIIDAQASIIASQDSSISALKVQNDMLYKRLEDATHGSVFKDELKLAAAFAAGVVTTKLAEAAR